MPRRIICCNQSKVTRCGQPIPPRGQRATTGHQNYLISSNATLCFGLFPTKQLTTSDVTIAIAHMPTRSLFALPNSSRLQTCLQVPVCSSHTSQSSSDVPFQQATDFSSNHPNPIPHHKPASHSIQRFFPSSAWNRCHHEPD